MNDISINKEKRERLIGLDVAKGIAIILMVYGHTNRIGSMSEAFNVLVDYIYTFHMPLFLLISGYLFLPIYNPKKAIKKTLNKIFLPYIIFISIYILLLFYINSLGIITSNTIEEFSFTLYIDKVFFHPIGSYWFLHTLIIYQVVLSFSFMMNRDKINWKFFIIFFILILLLKEYIGIKILINNIGFLIIGFLLRQGNISLPSNIFSIILISIILFTYESSMIREEFFLQVILVLALLSSIMFFSDKTKSLLITNFISYVGRNTLVILLFHAFYVNFMKVFMTFFLKIDNSGILFSVSTLFITVYASIFTAYILDYLKISKYIFHVNCIYNPFERK